MGKKYTLKKSIVKKRPKKRGKYREKPYDPKKPSTQEEKDEIFDGYEDFARLQKGIVETDQTERDDKQRDKTRSQREKTKRKRTEQTQMESFIPPEKWGRLMSDKKSTQLLFEERLKYQREKFGGVKDEKQAAKDVWGSINSDESKLESELATRLQKVQDESPDFVRLLAYLVEPLLDSPAIKPDPEGEMVPIDSLDEKKKHRAEQSFDKMDANQIQQMCRKRFGLMTLDALLHLIDRLNQASAGKLNTPNNRQ